VEILATTALLAWLFSKAATNAIVCQGGKVKVVKSIPMIALSDLVCLVPTALIKSLISPATVRMDLLANAAMRKSISA